MFKVKHNVDNYGIIIYDTIEDKSIVYMTDFSEAPLITGIKYWLYEINYDESTINKIIDEKDITKLHVANNINFHNSLENSIQYFSRLETKPQLIIACHTSQMGGNKQKIMEEMKNLCEKIEIAEKGKSIIF